MSDANRVALGLVPEVTFNTTPASPAFESERFTGGALKYAPKTVTSNEIRPDRQVSDLNLVDQSVAGDLNFELSYGAQDTLIEASFFGTWTNKPTILNVTADSNITDAGTVANTFTVLSALGTPFKVGMLVQSTGFAEAANNLVFRVTSSTATTIVGTALGLTAQAVPPAGVRLRVVGFAGVAADITATTSSGNALLSTALDFTTLGLVIGEWIKVGGTAAGDKFATAALNDWCRISAITATRLSLDIVPVGWAIDAGAGKTIKCWVGDYVRNGITERSFTIERQFQDLASPVYEYFTGCEPDQITFNIDGNALVTGSVKWMGAGSTMVTARVGGATDTVAPTNAVMNASSNVGRIAENGTSVIGPNYVLSAKIMVANNLRAQGAVASLSPVGFGVGECTVTLELQTYFGDKTLADKVKNNTVSSFDIRVFRSDANGQTILFDVPKTKYSDGAAEFPGKNSDVVVNLAGQGLLHTTLGYQIHCSRYAYTET